MAKSNKKYGLYVALMDDLETNDILWALDMAIKRAQELHAQNFRPSEPTRHLFQDRIDRLATLKEKIYLKRKD